MERFVSYDGTAIAYVVAGDGPPVLLLHGFAADHHANWVAPGVVGALVDAGRRVIASDARGHGQSDKPHEPEAYGGGAMARDAMALLDHLDIDSVDVVGYSMGSLVASQLVPADRRARSLVLGGVGALLARGRRPGNVPAIAEALVADDPAAIADAGARAFHAFADSTGADRLALAAIQRAPQARPVHTVADISVPTLILVGDRDTLVGPPDELAAAINGAVVRIVSGDHLSAVGDPAFRESIVGFLDGIDQKAPT